jgi:hypothetical protein
MVSVLMVLAVFGRNNFGVGLGLGAIVGVGDGVFFGILKQA